MTILILLNFRRNFMVTTFKELLINNDLTLWYDSVQDQANFFTVTSASRINNQNVSSINNIIGETGKIMLSKGMQETKQDRVQLLLPLQAFLLREVLRSGKLEEMKTDNTSFAALVDEVFPKDKVGDKYREFLEFSGHEHIRSFSTPAPKFKDLVSAPNSISISDMIEDVVELDLEAGYERTMSIAPNMQDMAYLSMCIAGEAGEIANSCKKLIRDGHTDKEMTNLEDELVDVMIYIAKLADNASIDLNKVWKRKFDELYTRNGLTVKDTLAHDKR